MSKLTATKGVKAETPKAPDAASETVSETATADTVRIDPSDLDALKVESLGAIQPDVSKAVFCARCSVRFGSNGNEFCPKCLAQAQSLRKASHAGYVLCEVVGSGMVRAEGFVDDVFKVSFNPGDIAEFAAFDVASLPDSLKPI